MLPEFLKTSNLFKILYRIDQELAQKCSQDKCVHCGSPLYQSNYQRKPRGGPEGIPEEYLLRHSLCCGQESCRRRKLPPSCRFFGRRVYWGCIILVVMSLRQSRPDGASARKLKRLFGVTRPTIIRWMIYFREHFPISEKWRQIRGRVGHQVKDNELPGGLVSYFYKHSATNKEGMVNCLRLLATGE